MNERQERIFYEINALNLEYCALCEILAKIVSERNTGEDDEVVKEALKFIKIMGDLL